jgi:hypothetical protein
VEHRREPVPHRQLGELSAVTEEQLVRNHHERVSVRSRHRGKGLVELIGTLHLEGLQLQP